MKPSIVVVIPYFQRTPGLLVKALDSVAAQQVDADLRVVVVDDASPHPAKAELAAAGATPLDVELIEQANQGPGGARNAALDRLNRETPDFVAFLDSDDRWRPQHLRRALDALASGCDVYFSNFFQLGADVPAFERTNRLALGAHPPIGGNETLRSLHGDMLARIVTGNVIGTSTVVYRLPRFPAHRFRTQFRRAGEDYLFWMGLAAKGAAFCFGTAPMVDYGRGVNVYSSAGWGSDGLARRLFDEAVYRRESLRDFSLTEEARTHIRSELRHISASLAKDVLHRARHSKAIDWRLLAAFARARPQWPLDVVASTLAPGRR